jgi:pSer/pThr/pTyr-binding forkhead associated (FHA) protein
MGMMEVVLRFIAGRNSGREIPVKNAQELVIGRAEDADLRIDEDTVSRRHAILAIKNDEIVLQDCSKNGTFVNGRPILTVNLKHGDQIHIGHSILKVASRQPVSPLDWIIGENRAAHHETAAMPVARTAAATKPTSVATATPVTRTATTEHFRGSIGEIVPADLLQLFTTTRKTGTLVLRSRDVIGRIHFLHGQLRHVAMDDAETVNALKVLYRLLRWNDGTFEFEPADGTPVPQTIKESTEQILLEAMQQLDEINNLGPQLPPLHAELAIADPLPAPMRDLAPGDLDFIQLALRHKTVRGILDHYSGTDFDGYIHIKSLLARRYLIVTGN